MSNIYDRVLITGGGGMLANALVLKLRSHRINPIAQDRAALDITAEDAGERIEERRPTLVINCAAYTKVDLAESERERAAEVNCNGAVRCARAAWRCGARFVHYSTDFVFDGTSHIPYKP